MLNRYKISIRRMRINMIRIAIVEDEHEPMEALVDILKKYQEGEGVELSIKKFKNAVNFLEQYDANYDMIFLDIKMPLMNGMDVAKKVRETDSYVLIVFTTNMQQYALAGYSVNAYDFLIKPVGYYAIETLMKKANKYIASHCTDFVIVRSGREWKKIPINSIYYIDVWRHKLTYHTQNGDIDCWCTLTEAEKQLPAAQFAYSNSGVLVNLEFVDAVDGEEVVINDMRLKMSRLRKKDFMAMLAAYLGSES